MDGREPEPIELSVMPPGATSIVLFRDVDGRPLQELEVVADLPAGPLRDQLHPAVLKTDGRGRLRLDGLCAGKHVLRAMPARQSGAEGATGAPYLRIRAPGWLLAVGGG